ncbi:MAG: hypothetical protein AAFV53_01860, partial [Myxococcota bacterium]
MLLRRIVIVFLAMATATQAVGEDISSSTHTVGVAISPAAPLAQGYDFSVLYNNSSGWSFALILRGGMNLPDIGERQMFAELGDVRVNIDRTTVINPRYYFFGREGPNEWV